MFIKSKYVIVFVSVCVIAFFLTLLSCTTVYAADYNKSLDKKVDTGKWRLMWSDEFNGTKLDDTKWSLLKSSYSNNEQSYYSMENVKVTNGELTLSAHKGANPDNKPYVSGAITSKGKFSQTYGRFEARMILPTGKGYWPAFWLLPDDFVVHGPWPACGEIDILETGGDISSYCGTLHFSGKNNQHAAKGIGSVKLPNNGLNADYHVYAIEWEPTEMRWYCDNVLMGTIKNWSTYGPHGQEQQPLPAPFNKDFYILLNLAVGGNFVGNKLPADGNTNGEMKIDYVRVYSKDKYEMPKQLAPKKVVKNLKPSGVNLIENGDFKDSSTLLWEKAGWEIIKPRIENGEMLVHVNKDVNEQHKQLVAYTKPVNIKKGTTYRLSFKARSDVECKHLRPVVERPKANWAKIFLYSSLELGNEMKEFSFDFTATANDNNSALLFYTGLMAGDTGGGNHTIYFDDIRLEEMVE